MEQYVQSSRLNEGYKNSAGRDQRGAHLHRLQRPGGDGALQRKGGGAFFPAAAPCIVTRRKGIHLWLAPPAGQLLPGKALRRTAEYLAGHSESLTASIDGCGTGCDSVALAEYALETGDFDSVELYAYKAMYKAKAAGRPALRSAQSLRWPAWRSCARAGERSPQLMEPLRQEVLRENNPVLEHDLCAVRRLPERLPGAGAEIRNGCAAARRARRAFCARASPFTTRCTRRR